MAKTVYTQCQICLSACGIKVTVDEETNRVVEIEPDRENAYTWRDFCRKGKTANEIAEHPRRITRPMRRVGDRYVEATYDEAATDIAERLNAIIDRYGPDAVGSYSGNPLGFSFSASTFFLGLLEAIGTGNRFWVGSVDQNNTHVVAEHVYGDELMPQVPDIDHCDFFLLVGMDPSISRFGWIDNSPDGWNRVLKRQREGAEVVIVDPRRSVSAAKAKTHLAILPGGDWALLLGMIKVIFDEGLERLSTAVPLAGVEDLRALAAEPSLAELADRCGLEVAEIEDVARRFAGARTAMCVCHTGVAHSRHGTIGEWLGHALNLITDRTDRPGGRRFERGVVDTRQVMNIFLPPSEHRTRLRNLPPIAGFHALAELADEITTPGEGQIRAMLIAAGNPVVSGPDSAALDKAFEQLDLLVAFDLVQRESHRHADWLIPGVHWLERDEFNPVFSKVQEVPYVNYCRQAIDPPEGVKDEAEFFMDLALAMDRNLFGRPGVNKIVRASRRLAKLTGRPKLAMNAEWVQRALILLGRRVKWKDIKAHHHGYVWGKPRYGDMAEALATPDKKVALAPEPFIDRARAALGEPATTSDEFPLMLTNKRSRESMNSWLNESPGLKAERSNPAWINPRDAGAVGVENGDQVRIASEHGAIEVETVVTDEMRPGVVCIAHGWGSRVFDPGGSGAPESFGTNRNVLVGSDVIDPLSQIPLFNTTAVRLEPVDGASPATPGAQVAGRAG